jgi:hypothetical protein
MDQTGWSSRGLALAAGCTPDAIRNVTRKLTTTPRGDALDRIAEVLGISVAALEGKASWPKGGLEHRPAVVPEALQSESGRGRLERAMKRAQEASKLAWAAAHVAQLASYEADNAADEVDRILNERPDLRKFRT